MSFHRDNETESPARLNRVLAQARRTEKRRRDELSSKELIAASRLELGLLGPRVSPQHFGRNGVQQH